MPPAFRARVVALVALAVLAPVAAEAVQPNFRIYLDEFPRTPLGRVVVGADAGPAPMSTLGFANGAALEAASAWDFSSVTGQQVVLQTAPVQDAWSCYVPDPVGPPPCGFDLSGNDLLLVRDNLVTGTRGATALDFDGTGTFLERAQVVSEGTADEVRVCLNPSAHPDVPFYVFGNLDGARRYMAAGDSWQSPVFSCNTDPLNVTSGAACPSFSGGQSGSFDDGNSALGRGTGRAVIAGTLTLPSGHVVDALLVEILASFNVRLACLIDVSRVRLYQLAWLIPHYGAIAQVNSPQDTAGLAAWTTAEATSIGYGVLPPLDVAVDSVGGTTMTVSWTPGNVLDAVDEWIVQWGPQSGTVAGFPFDSKSAGDTIPGTQSSYTIRGLQPDTTYFVSVMARKTYRDPLAGVDTVYDSISLPLTIGADVNGDGTRDTSYPVERSATTTAATDGLAVNRRVDLASPNPIALVAPQFDAACVQPPFVLCPDLVQDGTLPLTLAGEAGASPSPRLGYYEHSSPIGTMKVSKSGLDLRFDPN